MTKLSSIFLTVFLIFTSYVNEAQELSLDEPESYEILEISGQISASDESVEGATLELFENNQVVHSIETKKNGKFKFTLMSDMIYTIQITKEGYYPKRISVNTKVPAEVDGNYDFDFDINIDSKSENKFDPYLVEYPSALISYHEKKDEFIYDRDYTKSYFEDIEQ